jgi:predicted ATPase
VSGQASHGVGNLPPEVTSFVGRRRDLAAVTRRLKAARLVTLTGGPGVGKTRLALRVAGSTGQAFPGGIWLVSLSQLNDGALVTHTVARALGIRDEGGGEPLSRLIEFLGRRPALLVLDSCEHIVDACATLADTLLRNVAHLRVVATSRQTLDIPGEYVYPVGPLPFPDHDDAPPPPPSKSGAHREYPAMTLFAQRAASSVPKFAITADNRSRVARICRRLDGIPQPIELAAAGLQTLSIDELVDRLEDRLAALASPHPAAGDDQLSFRAAVESSFGLCTPQERTVWLRVSVFTGTFGLETAEEICAGDGIPAASMWEVLDGLISKSVLRRQEQAGDVRFRLPETLRQYGLEKLGETGTEDALRRRHADWYLRLAERGDREWFGPDQIGWSQRLSLEHPDLQAALEYWLSTPGRADTGARMAAALWFYWIMAGGSMTEGRYWLNRALGLNTQPTRHRARALWALGYIVGMQAELDQAIRMLDEARALARDLGDGSTLAWVNYRLGTFAMHRGELESATALSNEALAYFRSSGEPDGAESVPPKLTLAGVCLLQGDMTRMIEIAEQVIATCRQYGERTFQSYALHLLARAEWANRNLDRAAEYARESLRLRRTVAAPATVAFSVDLLAWIAEASHDYERAALLFGALDKVRTIFGMALMESSILAPHDEYQARTREALGPPEYEELANRGHELELDQIIDHALGV